MPRTTLMRYICKGATNKKRGKAHKWANELFKWIKSWWREKNSRKWKWRKYIEQFIKIQRKLIYSTGYFRRKEACWKWDEINNIPEKRKAPIENTKTSGGYISRRIKNDSAIECLWREKVIP